MVRVCVLLVFVASVVSTRIQYQEALDAHGESPGWGPMMRRLGELEAGGTAVDEATGSFMETEENASGAKGDYNRLVMAFPEYRCTRKFFTWFRSKKLGEGGFGVVWKAVDDVNHQKLAIKQQEVRGWHCADCPKEAELDVEYDIQTAVSNAPYVLHVLQKKYQAGVPGVTNPYYYLVLPLAQGFKGKYDLSEYVEAKGKLQGDRLKLVLAQLALGIQGIHRAGFAHLDLKLQNALLDGLLHEADKVPKVLIADFGLSSHFRLPKSQDSKEGAVRVRGGTEGYSAPETNKHHYVQSNADWFTFGIMALMLATGGEYELRVLDFSSAVDQKSIRSKLLGIQQHFYHTTNVNLMKQLISLLETYLLKMDADKRFSTFNLKDRQEPYNHPFWKDPFWQSSSGNPVDWQRLAR